MIINVEWRYTKEPDHLYIEPFDAWRGYSYVYKWDFDNFRLKAEVFNIKYKIIEVI